MCVPTQQWTKKLRQMHIVKEITAQLYLKRDILVPLVLFIHLFINVPFLRTDCLAN